MDQSYPETPLENEMIHFTEHPHLKQHLLTWRFGATKKFGLPKRFIISNNEVDGFDESVYSSKVSLLQSLWFASNDSLLCKKLTQNLDSYLKSVEFH
jgi:hypothetical protein